MNSDQLESSFGSKCLFNLNNLFFSGYLNNAITDEAVASGLTAKVPPVL